TGQSIPEPGKATLAQSSFTTGRLTARKLLPSKPTSTENTLASNSVTFPLQRMRALFTADNALTAGKGALGMSATTAASVVSTLPTVEIWLRIVSLIVG